MKPASASPHDHPFTVAEGLRAGLTQGRMRGPAFRAPFHGVRVRGGDESGSERADAWVLAREYAPRLKDGQFFSHEFALALYGAPTPGSWRPTVHVSAYRPAQPPRTRGVHGHRLRPREQAWMRVRGVPLESPVRAWAQSSYSWSRDDLIAAGDFLVARRRPLATIAEIFEEATYARGRGWARIVEEIRVGSESPRETQLRLVLVRAGLPEPELNIDLTDGEGRFVARSDLAYREFKVAVEYDGRQHALDARQFAHDADRWDAIRALGWVHIRILHHHLFPDPARAVEKVRSALVRAGWIPPPVASEKVARRRKSHTF